MKMGLVFALFLTNCTASFQPFPSSFSKQEVTAAFQQRDAAISILTEAIKEIRKDYPAKEKKNASTESMEKK